MPPPQCFRTFTLIVWFKKFPQICQPVCFDVFQGVVRNVEMKGFSGAYSSNLELQAVLKYNMSYELGGFVVLAKVTQKNF